VEERRDFLPLVPGTRNSLLLDRQTGTMKLNARRKKKGPLRQD
jgi:hypothetical protein